MPLACPSLEKDMTVSPAMSPDDNSILAKAFEVQDVPALLQWTMRSWNVSPIIEEAQTFFAQERGGSAGMVKGTRRIKNSNSNGDNDDNSNLNRRAQRQQQVRGSSS